MSTQVAIIGAGLAGLLPSHLLHPQGIEPAVPETRSRAESETTIRADVPEQGTVGILNRSGIGVRMQREVKLHPLGTDTPSVTHERQSQRSEPDYVVSSRAAATALIENHAELAFA